MKSNIKTEDQISLVYYAFIVLQYISRISPMIHLLCWPGVLFENCQKCLNCQNIEDN